MKRAEYVICWIRSNALSRWFPFLFFFFFFLIWTNIRRVHHTQLMTDLRTTCNNERSRIIRSIISRCHDFFARRPLLRLHAWGLREWPRTWNRELARDHRVEVKRPSPEVLTWSGSSLRAAASFSQEKDLSPVAGGIFIRSHASVNVKIIYMAVTIAVAFTYADWTRRVQQSVLLVVQWAW